MSYFRKINLCYRYFKLLDIFFFFRDINWIVFDVDIYYFYESVYGSQLGENNNIKELFYVSVSSDEKLFLSYESNGRVSIMFGSFIDSDVFLDDGDVDYFYVSVSEDERLKIESFNGFEQCYLNCESDLRDSGVLLCFVEFDSDFVLFYVFV